MSHSGVSKNPLDSWFWCLLHVSDALTAFIVSWVAPHIFSPIFANKLTKGQIRFALGLATFFCFIAFGISSDSIEKVESEKQRVEIEQNHQEVSATLEKTHILINEDKIREAQDVLTTAKERGINDPEIDSLKNKIRNLQSAKFFKNTLVNMSEDDFILLKNGELRKTFIEHEKLNSLFIVKLQENPKQRAVLIEEIEEEKRKKEEEAEQKKKEEETQMREERIENQFSVWDGSHRNLTQVIKYSMNDPKSYEHVETGYFDTEDHVIVITTFRGKNAFGGTVKNTVKAKVSLDGDVLEIIEEF